MKTVFSTKPLLTLFLSSVAVSSFAVSTHGADSIPTYNLEEVTVQASKVIRKADMDVYHPSKEALQYSSNGLQLLTYLSIPALLVDQAMGKVTAAGENVQIRINGREANVDQLRNLSPESIKKVEWIDNPGLRYNGANYVLNVVVANPTLGGSLYLNAQPALNMVFGNYMANVKFNHGKSQWEISSFFKPAIINKSHREYEESFMFPDGEKLSRTETPLSGALHNTQGNHNISYSYIKPDTTVFYAKIGSWNNYDDLAKYEGLLFLSENSRNIHLNNESGGESYNPNLSLYLEQHLKRNQLLVVDFQASLYIGHSFTDYLESYPGENYYFTDIHTDIRDFNQAYGIEADYIKNWNSSKLTAGLNYTANRNRSKYLYLKNAIFHQHQDKLYFFGEYFQKINKVSITAGIGAQYTTFLFKETDQGSNSWNLRPQATVAYSPNSNHQFRINFSSWQTAPSLSETNIAPQQTDGFQWNVGNPELKTYNNYRLNLRYGFNFKRINGSFNINATTSPKTIAPYLFWEGDKLITSYENSKGKQSLSFTLSPQIVVVPNWLIVSGSIEYLNERTEGKGYKLYNHNWNGNVQGLLTHWNFTFMVQYGKARRTLVGEKISWGEDFSTMGLFYNWKNWQFGAWMLMPFGTYDQGSKMLSKWNTNEYHVRIDMRMAALMISYNLQWGRQKKQVTKLIDADASVEKSTTKSR